MAKEVLKNVAILYGGVDLSSDTNELSLGATAAEVDFTNFASAGWREVGVGLRDAEWSFNGFWEAAEPDASLFAGVSGTPVTVTKTYPMVAGDIAYMMRTVRTRYELKGRVGDGAMYGLTLKGDRPMVRGKIIETLDAATANGNGGEVEVGAASATQTIYAALHVLSNSGGGTLDVTVESDATGFASPVTRFTFAQVSAVGSQYLTLAGPVTDTFYRAVRVIAGGGTWKFRVVVAIQ